MKPWLCRQKKGWVIGAKSIGRLCKNCDYRKTKKGGVAPAS
jgi:hypothetical protein